MAQADRRQCRSLVRPGDAVTMKRVGGAPKLGDCSDYIYWDTANPDSPQWAFFKANNVNYDIVSEYCSCGTPGPWCMHNVIH